MQHKIRLSGDWWRYYIYDVYLKEIDGYAHILCSLFLPTISDSQITEAANGVEAERWNRWLSKPATGEEDPSIAADEAFAAGAEEYQFLLGIRQGSHEHIRSGLVSFI